MKERTGIAFIFFALIALLGGVLFGTLSGLQFVYPGFLDAVPFFKSRPLHVSLVVSWIFLTAIGGIYYYLPRFTGLKLFSSNLARVHLWLFILTGVLIIGSYFAGKFGGREYWEFPPVLAIPILVSWVIFGFNYFKTVSRKAKQWPVYMWMWGTGIFFFFFTFSESYLWLLPYFRNSIVRDITVQWKAYGALVGSWNMLVYGTAIFVMERIKGDERIAHSKLSFLLYILGLTNLMFGWAHHIYIVPSAPWVRYLSYAVSMTELLLLGRIIWNWKRSVKEARKDFHILPYRFIVASDIWIFINLALAISISIPAINVFTHGTHITVAHAMGSTIGINTMILLASCFFLLGDATGTRFTAGQQRWITRGYWILNISLLVFWLALVTAGAEKGMLVVKSELSFQEIMQHISPALKVFAWSGVGIVTGLALVVVPALRMVLRFFRTKKAIKE